MKRSSILLPTLISDLIKFKVFIKLHLSRCNYLLQIKTFRRKQPSSLLYSWNIPFKRKADKIILLLCRKQRAISFQISIIQHAFALCKFSWPLTAIYLVIL